MVLRIRIVLDVSLVSFELPEWTFCFGKQWRNLLRNHAVNHLGRFKEDTKRIYQQKEGPCNTLLYAHRNVLEVTIIN